MSAANSRLQPIFDELGKLDRNLHALFAELLARKQPRSTLATIKDLYRTLQRNGMMSPSHSAEDEPEDRRRTAADPAPTEAEPPPPKDSGVTARRPGDGAAGQSLRTLFRRLAEALHPDKVQTEDEKNQRTEAMKEITRAYQDGDLARLLELERNFLTGSALTAPGDELDRRCAALQKTNAALRVQLDELLRELKGLRRSPSATMLHDFTRATQGTGQDPIDAMLAEANQSCTQLRELVDFIGAFRDGKIDVTELRNGPRFTGQPEPGDEDLTEFLAELFGQIAEPEPRRRKKRRRAGQSPDPF
jgi:hypothetical protein